MGEPANFECDLIVVAVKKKRNTKWWNNAFYFARVIFGSKFGR